MIEISNVIAAPIKLVRQQYTDYGAYFTPYAEGDEPVDLTGVVANMIITNANNEPLIQIGMGTGLFVFNTVSIGLYLPAGSGELPEGIYYGDLKLSFPGGDNEYPFNVIFESVKSYTT